MKVCLLVLGCAMLMAGCSGDSDRPDRLDPPGVDLTGVWRPTEPVWCDVSGSGLPASEAALIAAQTEETLPAEPGIRVVQTGNDLDIVSIADGDRRSGTIRGDRFWYAYSSERDGVAFHGDVFGIVLNEDHMAVINKGGLTIPGADGVPVDVGLNCTYHAMREVET